jgi:hypothetical protein
MKLILLTLFALGCYGQTLTFTIETQAGKATQTISGAPVVAGLEVLEAFRLSQYTEDPQTKVKTYKYATVGEVLRALIVGKIMELSEQYPTSATATLRAAKAKADADLAAARKALEAAATK